MNLHESPRLAYVLAVIGLISVFALVGITTSVLKHLDPTGAASSKLPSTKAPVKTESVAPSGHEEAPAQDPQAARPGQGPVPAASPVPCPAPTATVHTPDELTGALAAAVPGTVIQLADGLYTGNYAATQAATADHRIYLCGGPNAILDGGTTESGYGFHLDHADHWVLSGFTVRNSQKGIVADNVTGAVIENLSITNLGDEAIHLRRSSSANLVLGNTVSGTGNLNGEYGEGIYVGTAESNWCQLTDCRPDTSNYNMIASNTISNTTAENIDIKEGTIGGIITGNRLNGRGMTEADAWVNVKGNAWTIENNTGTDTPGDGFQTHNILDGWGDYNLFRANTAIVNGPGHGIATTPALHNTVSCTNKVTAAGSGRSNTKCAP